MTRHEGADAQAYIAGRNGDPRAEMSWLRDQIAGVVSERDSLLRVLDIHVEAGERHDRQYNELQGRVDRALAAHIPVEADAGTWCTTCSDGDAGHESFAPWPCETVRILTGVNQ